MRSVAPSLRRSLALAGALLVVLATFAGAFEGVAGAQDGSDEAPAAETPAETRPAEGGLVEILEVSGLIDEVLADTIEDAVVAAERDGLRALVLQVNSRQAVVSDERLAELAALLRDSAVPVSVWVGPSSSQAAGRVAQLVAVADRLAVAPGAKLGPMGDQVLDPDEFGVLYGDQNALVADTALNWDQAIELGIVPCDFATVDELGRPVSEEEQQVRCAAPTVGDFLVGLPEFDSRLVLFDGETATPFDPDTVDVEALADDVELRREPITQARFRGLSLIDQLMHTVASPPVAYLMLVIGLALIVFELYSIGVGIAGAIGAVFAALGGYGIAALPVRGWAVVLIVVSMVAFAIDVQHAIPRAWTVIGMVLLTVGTLFLYPEGDVSMSWIPIVVALAGMAVVVFRGLPIMVRGRFSTSAVPRTFLVEETGTVVEAIERGADGSVEVRGVTWRAVADDPVPVGATVCVVDTEGLDLVVALAGEPV